ncbi:MAG TPA: serine hydrolase [Chthoniobacteraceae bacterium]|nr:serine hydrolase [Chthoniobacteraceae bacterium]
MLRISVLTSAIFALIHSTPASEKGRSLDEVLDDFAPGVKKWAAVCEVTNGADGAPVFTWHDYRETGFAVDFWPASCIKIYAVVAALELLNERGFPLDTAVTFERRTGDGEWVLDCARTVREMCSEVFRRSSNEDYTLLLRMVGIDRINTHFLVPEKGFPHSALMRGYVLGRPYGYVREEPQRITLIADGRRDVIEHTWSGHSYSEERGGSIFDAKTGNVTSPRELAESLRRIVFHEQLPVAERFRLTPEQLELVRYGHAGLIGLETVHADSGPYSWKDGLDVVFPGARFYHKCGSISSYTLETAYLDDSKQSGRRFILVPVVAAGTETKPEPGKPIISKMSRAIGEWIRDRSH